MIRRALLVCALAAVAASPALAAPPGVSADHPWIRATPPGALTAAGYLTLNNRGPAADRLMGGSTPAARSVTVHRTVMSQGMARMSAVPSLEIGPGRAIAFKPGGYHLMLVGLKGPLAVGETVPVTLNFQRGGAITIPFTVEQQPMAGGDHDMHGMH